MGMFDGLKQLGDLNQMRQQAQAIQQKLAAERVEVVKQTAKGLLKIVLTGDQKIVEVSYDGVRDMELEAALSDVIYKSQMVAAGKLQELTAQQ
ncbi:MAG: YbaB/EbfC family nucleoid-associated protein [Patescibacteria group bacterium]